VFFARRRLAAALAGRRGRAAALTARVLTGLPQRPAGLALDLGLSWLSWGVKLAALGLVLGALAQVPAYAGILGAIGGDLSTVLPVHAPGGFGSYEAGVLALLAPAADGAPLGPLLAAAVDLHLLVLTTALLAGAAAWACAPRARPAA
ncbi:MAG: flippase-like domain-containing protein, partial [Nevskia sp.]|nr:flippase-like domain-containing protein [Nevskia sp.]